MKTVLKSQTSVSGVCLSADKMDSPVLVYFLSGALTFTTILVAVLALSVFKMKKRTSYQSTGNLELLVYDGLCSLHVTFD